MTEMFASVFVYTLIAFVVLSLSLYLFPFSLIYAHLGRHSRYGMEEKSGSTLLLSFLFPQLSCK